RPTVVDTHTYRATILPPPNTNISFTFPGWSGAILAMSPDGQRLAFIARDADGKVQLWVRPLSGLSAQPLAGTDGASAPFWSPDSKFIGFFAEGKLKKIDAAGGPPLVLCDAEPAVSGGSGGGGTWNRDGVIVFGATRASVLQRVSSAGGPPAPPPAPPAPTPRADPNGAVVPPHRPPFFLVLVWSPTAAPQSPTGLLGALPAD